MHNHRFADAETVTQYPLDIPAAAEWRPCEHGVRASVPLDNLAAGTIITPSLSILGMPDHAYQFTLRIGRRHYALRPVPAPVSATEYRDSSDSRLRTAIDCFHTLKKAVDCELIADCFTEHAPQRYLLTVSTRADELQVESIGVLPDLATTMPPARSQMLENPRIAGRICSPMSTAMALRLHRPCVDYGAVIAACFDPVTRMYGMWPLAIRVASHYGSIGAVELIADWQPVIAALERDLPVIASIRYAAGELPGAALTATAGHLVVVYGLDDGHVLVNDPGAPHHGSVPRRYPLDAFSRAWFRHRGAAYILA